MNEKIGFWTKVGIVFGAIGTVLGVMISWQSIEVLPRWAWHTEVTAVEDFAKDTRLLVLGQEWERLDREISKLEDSEHLTPDQRELLSTKRLRQKLVEQQLQALQENN